MPNGLDVKMRDFGREIAADDPLMELSRIMGFDKPRAANDRADPQIVVEDSFSMDLERELALDEIREDAPAQLDAEITAAFEEELSEAIQFGEDAPSVVPSLEDELNALLGGEPAPASTSYTAQATAPARNWFAAAAPAHAEPEPADPELSWLEEELDVPEAAAPIAGETLYADNWQVEPADKMAETDTSWLEDDGIEDTNAAAPLTDDTRATIVETVNSLIDEGHDETLTAEAAAYEEFALPQDVVAANPSVERAEIGDNWLEDDLELPVSNAAPAEEAVLNAAEESWLDINLDDQLDMAGSEPESAYETLGEKAPADPVFAQMSRATPTAYQPVAPVTEMAALDGMDFDFGSEDAEPEYEREAEPIASSPSEYDSWRAVNEAAAEPKRSYNGDFGRLLAETSREPVVEASEPQQDAVSPTDDFEIPDFDFSPEPQHVSASPSAMAAMADYEPEYKGYGPKVEKAAVAATPKGDFDFEALLNEQFAGESVAPAAGLGAAAGAAAAAAMRPKINERVDADIDFQPFGEAPAFPEVDYGETAPRRKSWIIPALLAGAAVLGGGLYYAFSGNSVTTTAAGPALVKADPQPVKVAPENPGGKTVPDQDKAVYDKVEGEASALPSQGTLVSESEEPVDIASVAGDAAAKSEARVDPAAEADADAAQSGQTAAVSPKKVRTFIVKPDGTLVERPAEAAAPVAAAKPAAVPAAAKPAAVPVAAKPAAVPVAAKPVAVAAKPAVTAVKPVAVAVKPAPAAPAAAKPAAVAAVKPAVPAKPATAVKPAAAVAEAAAPAQENLAKLAAVEPASATKTPAAVEAEQPAPAIKVVKTKKIKAPAAESNAAPVLDSRPADQPVTIVGKTGGQKAAAEEVQVAAADASPAAAGGYAIQIASTPSPEAAKSTYAALNRKFLNVIGGRGVSIQKAEVDGKGTVYRVRIPAGSKKEAAALCAQYKASGGSCFVTK